MWWVVGPKVHLVIGFSLKTGSQSKMSEIRECWKPAIKEMIFCNFAIFQKTLDLPQVKRWLISTVIRQNCRIRSHIAILKILKIFGNEKILDKSQNWVHIEPSLQSSRSKTLNLPSRNFSYIGQTFSRSSYQRFLLLSSFPVQFSCPATLLETFCPGLGVTRHLCGGIVFTERQLIQVDGEAKGSFPFQVFHSISQKFVTVRRMYCWVECFQSCFKKNWDKRGVGAGLDQR